MTRWHTGELVSMTTWHSLWFSQAQWKPRFPPSRPSCGAEEDGANLISAWELLKSLIRSLFLVPGSSMESFPRSLDSRMYGRHIILGHLVTRSSP